MYWFYRTRLEKTVAGAACCAQMGKACCGGGCCESTKLISACCGIKHDETTVKAPRAFDQSQPVQSRNLMHRPGNSLAPAMSAPGVHRIECAGFNSGNCPANPINTARENVAPSYDMGGQHFSSIYSIVFLFNSETVHSFYYHSFPLNSHLHHVTFHQD